MGSHVSLFETGSGQVLLAFRPPEERLMMIAEHLKSSDEPTISPEFAARLDAIRDQGYAMMPSIQIAGVMNLSAPVLRPDGRALAALTVPFVHLANVPAAPDMMETLRLIRATAARLSRLAGAGVAGQ
jgi:DNA-binding IclR family transcriptional regulator